MREIRPKWNLGDSCFKTFPKLLKTSQDKRKIVIEPQEHGLMLMKSSDLENNMELFQSPNLDDFLTNLNNSLEKEYIQSEDKITGQEQEQGAIRFLASIQSWVSIFNGVLNGDTDGAGKNAAEAILYGDEYYIS